MRGKLIYFGFGLSAVLLWLVLRKIDVARMIQAVLAINGRYFTDGEQHPSRAHG